MKLNLEDLGLDIQKPILIIPNLSTFHDNQTKSLSLLIGQFILITSLLPLGDLEINYFTDSTKVDALKLNLIASLSEIVHNSTNDFNSKIKIGTQIPVENYPSSLIHNVAPNDIVTQLFGNHFCIDDLNPYLGISPQSTTVPIFLARGLNKSAPEKSHNINQIRHQGSSCDHHQHTDNSTNQRNVRTDLHCEPIGNISIQQLKGSEQ